MDSGKNILAAGADRFTSLDSSLLALISIQNLSNRRLSRALAADC